ncbi:hypothetical protein [Halalkalibacter alkaliphilus]|uniref:Fungal lipase-like domain-containing protein n=1 Tax=Halalkalibacter alkaliphilus TaxID=2917993 RepID=A0A9X2I479_9BACI|nr:hypothetical protein [Halalkalibacter alkaliphilus]MCL7747323.1 hypothetical protein [Halalkalibacter alkaliphilus]
MSGVTDIEYRLLSNIAYYDEITEELNEVRDKHILPIKFSRFPRTLSRLENELKKFNSSIISSGIDYKNILGKWSVLHSVQSLLKSSEGIQALRDAKYKNLELDAFVFIKETFDINDGIKKFMVIGYRGTNLRRVNQLLRDLQENGKTTNNKFFAEHLNQSDWASVFFQLMHQKYSKNFEISLTGHSKGGALVQKVILVALQRDNVEVSGVTFSSSGVLKVVDAPEEGTLSQSDINKYSSLCTNFVIDVDPVLNYVKALDGNFKTTYVGKVIILPHKSDGNAHRIASSFDNHFDKDGFIK